MTRSLAQHVARLAREQPDAPAYLTPDGSVSWAAHDARARRLAAILSPLDLEPRARVGVLLPDGPDVHAAFLANERAGLITLGIGPRAGAREIEHLLRAAGAQALVTGPEHDGASSDALVRALRATGLPLHHHVQVTERAERVTVDARPVDAPPPVPDARALGPDDVFLLNSTSGTTGMPKVVVHDQRRWLAFHDLAVRAAALSGDDVFASLVPAPFGFGLWTRHFTPTLLGAPTLVVPRFSAPVALAALEERRATVLAAVTTQLILLLDALRERPTRLRALRVVFTGGEPVPYERAAEFEERTGATVLQFYGSNETGAVSGTTLADPREKRLRTAGRPVPEMHVRLFAPAGEPDAGRDVTASGRGQPGCKGPTLSRGYWNDPEGNAALIRPDGWMLLGDVVEIDAEGYLRVVGRTEDFIIRGGKNISGPAVEEAVATHPAVALVAAVAMPDPVFGERVCVYVEPRPGAHLTLEALVAHLRARGVSKESLPERLELCDALPRGSGGKIAKQRLREDIRARLANESR